MIIILDVNGIIVRKKHTRFAYVPDYHMEAKKISINNTFRQALFVHTHNLVIPARTF
jgi:hypothetical protein